MIAQLQNYSYFFHSLNEFNKRLILLMNGKKNKAAKYNKLRIQLYLTIIRF